MNLLILFIILNIINVIVQTAKSIITVKGNKYVAAVVNAIAYGFYTVVVIYMLCDLPLFTKAFIVALCNLVGVFVVKFIEEKSRKTKLWKIELTIPTPYTRIVDQKLVDVPHSYQVLSPKHCIFTFYCASEEETLKVKEVVDKYKARYFITENHAIL